jgi:hypothetical protein
MRGCPRTATAKPQTKGRMVNGIGSALPPAAAGRFSMFQR